MLKKTAAKKTAAKNRPAKRTVGRKAVAKKSVAPKRAVKKTTARKIAAKKRPAKRTVAKKTTARQTAGRKRPANKTVAKKSTARRNPAEQNIASVKAAYAGFSSGDAAAAMAILADDIEWIVPGNSAVSGTYRGKGAVGSFWMKLVEKSFATAPEHYVGDGERVVVLTRITVAGQSADQADVLTFKNSKVVKFQSAGDTALHERIFGAK